jgi:hypothetical protein
MVNLPQLQRIATELAPVNHIIGNGNNGSCRVKPRKRMANRGFMRSDRWSIKHGYSYNTVNKYRGVLYGDEAFLPPTPTTGGRIRIANEVADKLRTHGVRARHSEAKRPSCRPKPVTPAPVQAPADDTVSESREAFTQLFARLIEINGTDFVIDCLADADLECRASAT